MEPAEIRPVGPYAGSENRHLHLIRKAGADAGGPAAARGHGEEAPAGSGVRRRDYRFAVRLASSCRPSPRNLTTI